MDCLQYSIQSMMPSLLGTPSGEQMMNCSNYAILVGGAPGAWCNSVTGECGVPQPGTWNHTISTTQGGEYTVWCHPSTDAQKATYNLWGLSFLPWNVLQYERYPSRGGPIPINPWNSHTIMTNGLTIAKVAGIGLVSFYVGKFAVKKLSKRI